jgi:bifunctional enzyme CysN/CysC
MTTLMETETEKKTALRDQMNIVVAGHVDHGKSTVIGRLMADTGSLPEGKLEQVKAMCERNARPFEFAFLLDALKNEQAQGITIDTARCFFKTARRNYIINDAPGHIEFLKNMITGAARAECALLVIDAHEGIQENSRRHGYMISMLGIRQIAVLVNKMDLKDYDEAVFSDISRNYAAFLDRLEVHPACFIPVSAREGDNIASRSGRMSWFQGPTVLEQVDLFEEPSSSVESIFRMPVQDIYKFTQDEDDRRIISGTIESGRIHAGDEITFYPSGKSTSIRSIEGFNTPAKSSIESSWAAGFTMDTQIYIKPGDLMCHKDDPAPNIGRRFRANMFWMGRLPMVREKHYKLKIGATRVSAQLADVISVLDASELNTVEGKGQVERHDVAECIIETAHPVAFDTRTLNEETSRFVIVDEYEIAGAGIILEQVGEEESLLRDDIRQRESRWETGQISSTERTDRYGHAGMLVLFVGRLLSGKRKLAKQVERMLFEAGGKTYYFGITNLTESFEVLDRQQHHHTFEHDRALDHLGELTRLLTDAGLIILTCLTDVDDFDMEKLRQLNAPKKMLVVTMGDYPFNSFKPDLELPENPVGDKTAAEQVIGIIDRNEVSFNFSI